MPFFLLMGGEIVIAIVGSRMALWVWRGLRMLRAQPDSFSPQPPPAERIVGGKVAEVRELPMAPEADGREALAA